MHQSSLDRIITEEEFALALAAGGQLFFRLGNSLLATSGPERTRKHLYQLVIEADSVEVFLDDHGARYNQAFFFFRELVASIRGFARAGFALAHLAYRFEGYRTRMLLLPDRLAAFRESLSHSVGFLRHSIEVLMRAAQEEAELNGVEWGDKFFPEEDFRSTHVNLKLPRNLGEETQGGEGMRPSEIASKYLEVCSLLEGLGIRPIHDEGEREAFLGRICREEQARVYEATVHNLQSAYDTHFKNTTLELEEPRLIELRGHASAAFHLLEAVTILAHFVERHESHQGAEALAGRMNRLVQRSEVRAVTLNHLLSWAAELLHQGRETAQGLLSTFTNARQLTIELPPDLVVHARPASLIVGIVNHHGTPVEMEVCGHTANAGSILEVMIAVGSHPDNRTFVFRGDEHPLRDIEALFSAGLGEGGLDGLPASLRYLAE
ncbi:MAG: HPr family phosphocarrier protein [Planctomycetes bacterium]|nr:HPr family phosphocarrier protein [Planctomycetota bacterium]